jgi:hypothetical protein
MPWQYKSFPQVDFHYPSPPHTGELALQAVGNLDQLLVEARRRKPARHADLRD